MTTAQTQTFFAAGYDADDNFIADVSVTWTVTNGIGEGGELQAPLARVVIGGRVDPASRRVSPTVIADVPPPSGDPDGTMRALIFDSKFDQYRGVVCLVRVVDGRVREVLLHRLQRVRFPAQVAQQLAVQVVQAVQVEQVGVGPLPGGHGVEDGLQPVPAVGDLLEQVGGFDESLPALVDWAVVDAAWRPAYWNPLHRAACFAPV